MNLQPPSSSLCPFAASWLREHTSLTHLSPLAHPTGSSAPLQGASAPPLCWTHSYAIVYALRAANFNRLCNRCLTWPLDNTWHCHLYCLSKKNSLFPLAPGFPVHPGSLSICVVVPSHSIERASLPLIHKCSVLLRVPPSGLPNSQSRDWRTFSAKGQTVSISDFVSHWVFVPSTQRVAPR